MEIALLIDNGSQITSDTAICTGPGPENTHREFQCPGRPCLSLEVVTAAIFFLIPMTMWKRKKVKCVICVLNSKEQVLIVNKYDTAGNFDAGWDVKMIFFGP